MNENTFLKVKGAALTIRALNHRLRQRIVNLLQTHGELTVTDIYIKIRLEQSVASQHLAILRKAGIVLTERRGKFIYYSIDKNRLSFVYRLCGEMSEDLDMMPKRKGFTAVNQ